MTLEGTPELVAQSGIQGLTFRTRSRRPTRRPPQLKASGVKTIVVLLHEGGLQAGTYRRRATASPVRSSTSPTTARPGDRPRRHRPHPPAVRLQHRRPGRPAAHGHVGVVVRPRRHRDAASYRPRDRRRRPRARSTSANHLVTRTSRRTRRRPAIIDQVERARRRRSPTGSSARSPPTSPARRTATPRPRSANLIADAQLAATAPGDGGAQIALMNPGGVRADLTFAPDPGGEQPGEVTYGEAFIVQPFGNLLVTHGPDRRPDRAVLEQQAIVARPAGTVLIFGVSDGLTFTYDGTAARSAPGSIRHRSAQRRAHRPGRHVPGRRRTASSPTAATPSPPSRRAPTASAAVTTCQALIDYFGAHAPIAPAAGSHHRHLRLPTSRDMYPGKYATTKADQPASSWPPAARW